MALSVGTVAPDFSLPSVNGGTFTLSQNMAAKACILYFYPKNFTSVCTAEACSFRDAFAEFRGLSVDVVGISQDSIESHQKFREAYKLPFELLSDPDMTVANKYAAQASLLQSLIGVQSKRITYLLDAQHRIVALHDGLMDSKEHVESMLKTLKK